jgi:hypothetical protein
LTDRYFSARLYIAGLKIMSRVTASTIRNRSMASFGTGGDDPHQVRRGNEDPA